MPNVSPFSRPIDDYPLSLQMAARALWGDDFWGAHKPLPVSPEAAASRKTDVERADSR